MERGRKWTNGRVFRHGVVIAKTEASRIRGFTVVILRRIEVEEGSQSDSMVSSSVLEVVCLCPETRRVCKDGLFRDVIMAKLCG
jgi:hypothetical protein